MRLIFWQQWENPYIHNEQLTVINIKCTSVERFFKIHDQNLKLLDLKEM